MPVINIPPTLDVAIVQSIQQTFISVVITFCFVFVVLKVVNALKEASKK